jgi:hypothetical protein
VVQRGCQAGYLCLLIVIEAWASATTQLYQQDRERPCLHCMMVELIDDFFAEYPAPAGGSDKVDTTEADEVIGAIAKTVAELTSQQDGRMRQQLIEHLMREIMNYDAEFRSEEATGSSGSIARH